MRSTRIKIPEGFLLGTGEKHRKIESDTVFVVVATDADAICGSIGRLIGERMTTSFIFEEGHPVVGMVEADLSGKDRRKDLYPEELAFLTAVNDLAHNLGSIAIDTAVAEMDQSSKGFSVRIELSEESRQRVFRTKNASLPLSDAVFDEWITSIEDKF